MRKYVFVALGVLATTVLLLQARVSAHHAFAAEFDADQPVSLTGTLTKFEWTNPHSWVYIDVKDPKTGQITNWAIEGAAPNNLLRRGFTKNMVPIGARIRVEGYRAKDRSAKRANGHIMQILHADGKRESLFMGSSGIGAPYERPARGEELDENGRPRQK
jgi:hypothetical protein